MRQQNFKIYLRLPSPSPSPFLSLLYFFLKFNHYKNTRRNYTHHSPSCCSGWREEEGRGEEGRGGERRGEEGRGGREEGERRGG